MFEVLSIRPPRGEVIEDTGAGAAMLMNGDVNFGYFGSFPESEIGLIPGLRDMLSEIGINISVDASKVRWFKFIRQGKVLLYPDTPLAQLSYVNLEEIGATYAKSDMGTTEALSRSLLTDAVLLTENPIVPAGQGSKYRVRLFNTIAGATAAAGQQAMIGSEFRDLITDVFSEASSIGLKLPISQFVSSRFLVQECINNTYTSVASYNGVIAQNGGYTKTNWIPVLEYIPPSYLGKNLITPQNLILGSNVTISAPIIEEMDVSSTIIVTSAPLSDNNGFVVPAPSVTTESMDSIDLPLNGSVGVPSVTDSEYAVYEVIPYSAPHGKETLSSIGMMLPVSVFIITDTGVRQPDIQTTPILD